MAQRTVIVTGATGALGSAVVQAFQNEGDHVVPVARSSEEWSYDLSKPGAAELLIEAVTRQSGGRLDVVVHTVGGYSGGSDWDIWTRMIETNLRSTAAILAASVPVFRNNGSGRFIAVGSRAGTVPSPGAAAYAATKAAVHSLVETAAAELKGSGVTVNAVLPSTIDTPANRQWGSTDQAASWVQPTSIAAAIFWLASDLAADVNGCLLPVYGGAA